MSKEINSFKNKERFLESFKKDCDFWEKEINYWLKNKEDFNQEKCYYFPFCKYCNLKEFENIKEICMSFLNKVDYKVFSYMKYFLSLRCSVQFEIHKKVGINKQYIEVEVFEDKIIGGYVCWNDNLTAKEKINTIKTNWEKVEFNKNEIDKVCKWVEEKVI